MFVNTKGSKASNVLPGHKSKKRKFYGNRHTNETEVFASTSAKKIKLEALICDTPAKAFVLCVKMLNWICFPQIDALPRTDDDFIRKIDDDYHKLNTTCSLLRVSHFKPVTNIPLDYMHLICLGIMRKLIYLWVEGNLHYRLRSRAVEAIFARLVMKLKPFIPMEFARKPRKLECVKLWKAMECCAATTTARVRGSTRTWEHNNKGHCPV
ncbi:hypothetical protein ALC60_12868 [Trachymyrmex zeteki]|uniref:Uncharacterized protein n=1 Tax=Mycetomoellerius zeteki TaxID=64791 RepID=A0A151WJT3_9HYME|nr:hypothetical protein ALC60_12868 [Trachymyrmex zeteki]